MQARTRSRGSLIDDRVWLTNTVHIPQKSHPVRSLIWRSSSVVALCNRRSVHLPAARVSFSAYVTGAVPSLFLCIPLVGVSRLSPPRPIRSSSTHSCPLIPHHIAHEYVTWSIQSPQKSRSLFSTRLEGGASSPNTHPLRRPTQARSANPPGSQAERACGKPKLS